MNGNPPYSAGFAGPYAFGYLHAGTGSFVTGWAVLMFCAVGAAMLMLLVSADHWRVSKSIGST
jgi:cyanate permease